MPITVLVHQARQIDLPKKARQWLFSRYHCYNRFIEKHACMPKAALLGPKRGLRMKLGPRKPEGLMAAKVGPISVDRFDTTRSKL